MAESKSPFLSLNLVVPRDKLLKFIKLRREILTLSKSSENIPPNVYKELFDCIYKKDFLASEVSQAKIMQLKAAAMSFFVRQPGYNFKGFYRFKTDLYDDFSDPFLHDYSQDLLPKEPIVFKQHFSLEDFVNDAIRDYICFFESQTTKETQLRDEIIRFFYSKLKEYTDKLPRDPFKKTGKSTYKKKVIAAYLAHTVRPINLFLEKADKLTCYYIFQISVNAFKKI